MSALQLLVCGTNYGSMYLKAIRMAGGDYDLAGILARGSSRSQQLARQYGVPLYRCAEDVGPGIDLACAAMGASGTDVVLRLLSRDINVLCEHPQRPACLESALDAAASRNLCFHVNGHFADLPAAATFISDCRRSSKAATASFFHVTATERSLYAVLDILHRVLLSFVPFDFQVSSRFPPFTIIQGLLGGVPATFHVQCGNNRPLADGSPAYLVDHRITAGFPSGVLTLLSMNGPVVWNANLNRATDRTEPLFAVAHEHAALSAEQLHRQRVAANLGAISALVKNMRERVTPPEQTPGYLLEVSRAWETLGGLL
jgi:thiazolinyl imide reductase